MDNTTYVAVMHETTAGILCITRVRRDQAEAYADSLKAEPFVKTRSVKVLPIMPASKTRLAEIGA